MLLGAADDTCAGAATALEARDTCTWRRVGATTGITHFLGPTDVIFVTTVDRSIVDLLPLTYVGCGLCATFDEDSNADSYDGDDDNASHEWIGQRGAIS